MFRDSSQHTWADFILIMEGPNVVKKLRVVVARFDMGTSLGNGAPPGFE